LGASSRPRKRCGSQLSADPFDERRTLHAAESFTPEQLSGYVYGLAPGGGHVALAIPVMLIVLLLAWGAIEALGTLFDALLGMPGPADLE